MIAAEPGGGALLILGVATRLVALLLVPIMIGTIVMVYGSRGWGFANTGSGWKYPAFWTATLVMQALIGSGLYAVYPI